MRVALIIGLVSCAIAFVPPNKATTLSLTGCFLLPVATVIAFSEILRTRNKNELEADVGLLCAFQLMGMAAYLLKFFNLPSFWTAALVEMPTMAIDFGLLIYVGKRKT
jgi:hypothetical protein